MKPEIKQILETMLEKHGKLTTEMVLKEARKKTSPLFSQFTWDDKKAAYEFRLTEARRLIKRYNVTVTAHENKLVHVSSSLSKGPGEYKTAGTIVKSLSEFERAMTEALSRLESAKQAVETLEKAADGYDDERLGLLAVSMRSIEAACAAISKMH